MINLIGNLNVDLILAQVEQRPEFGEEHLVDNMHLRPGALANVIYPLAKLGEKPRVIATLGKDEFGDLIFKEMEPLMENRVIRTETPTAVSVAVVNEEGSRYFVTYSGNFYDFTSDIIDRAEDLEQADATLFYGYFLLPSMGVKGAKKALRRAKAANQLTFFDANSAIDGWSEKSKNEIIELLPEIDFFMPNDEELCHLTGLSSIENSIDLLKARGAKTIIVKQGSNGATAYTDNIIVHHPGFPATAFDTTGAGDGFNAGFMYAILKGYTIEKCLEFGNALASTVVARKEDRYPTLKEIEDKIHSYQCENIK